MVLKTKYQQLIDAAQKQGVTNLQVREEGNVLYIDGNAPSEEAKKYVWDVYNKIDPDYRSGDVVLNLQTYSTTTTPGYVEYEVKQGDSLSRIGEKYGVGWKEIYALNKDIIKDPDLIHPGWVLKIPKKGDNA
jgi:nucleoid-associated protein YgaU